MTTTTQIIEDGDRNAVMLFTNAGQAETNVVKVDVSDLAPLSGDGRACTRVTLDGIQAEISSGGGQYVRILEQATTNKLVFVIVGSGPLDLCFKNFGGIPNSRQAGFTGNLLFSTNGFTNDSAYSIVLKLRKHYD